MKGLVRIGNLFREHRGILVILIAGLAVRVWRMNWGLPDIFEEATPAKIALNLWNVHQPGISLNPHFFNYPALTFYLNFLVQLVFYWAGHLLGSFPDAASFTSDGPLVTLIGRGISVLFDLGSVTVLWLLMERIAGRIPAAAGALFLALNPLLILQAHLVQVDTPLTFFCLLSTLFLVRLHETGGFRWYLLAGISAGLAAACKYPGALLLAALTAVHFLRAGTLRQAAGALRDRRLYAGLAAAAAVFVLLNPYIILSFQEFSAGFTFEEEHIATGHLGVNPAEPTILYYLTDVLPAACGWGMTALAAVTSLVVVARREKPKMVLLFFPVIYLLILSTWKMRSDRYLLPLIPYAAGMGSIGCVMAGEKIVSWLHRMARTGAGVRAESVSAAAVIALLVAVPPALSAAEYLRSLGLPDARVVTREWIVRHYPAGSIIATGPYGIDFPDSQYFTLGIPFVAYKTEQVAPFYNTGWYEDVDLLITSGYDYARFAREPERYASFMAFYGALQKGWKLEYASDTSGALTGPTFRLYSCPDSLRRSLIDPALFGSLGASPESLRISHFLKELNSVCLRKGKPEKSEQVLQAVLSVETDNIAALNSLGKVQIGLGKYKEALGVLGRSILLRRDQPEVYAMAGHALVALNHDKEAVSALTRAISLDPRAVSPYEDLMGCYDREGRTQELREVMKRYAGLLPEGSPERKRLEEKIAGPAGRTGR